MVTFVNPCHPKVQIISAGLMVILALDHFTLAGQMLYLRLGNTGYDIVHLEDDLNHALSLVASVVKVLSPLIVFVIK